MLMPARHANTGDYRYGYNGMENDNEVKGEGNNYTTHFRQLDPRLGRWFSIDPVIKTFQSPFTSMSNNPIWRIDPNGDDDFFDSKGNFLYSTGYGDEIRVVNDSKAFFSYIDAQSLMEDCNEELLTQTLRLNKYSLNVTDVKFRSAKPPYNILNHYGDKLLPEGSKIIPSNKYGDPNNAMSVAAYRGEFVKNKSKSGNLLGLVPVIYTPLDYNYSSEGNYYNISELLNTVENVRSIIVHEDFHLRNHVKKYYSDGLYEYLKVDRDLEGVLNHLDAYNAQISDSSYCNTTDALKKNTAVLICKATRPLSCI